MDDKKSLRLPGRWEASRGRSDVKVVLRVHIWISEQQLYGRGTFYGIKKGAVADRFRWNRDIVGEIPNNWSEICAPRNVLSGA